MNGWLSHIHFLFLTIHNWLTIWDPFFLSLTMSNLHLLTFNIPLLDQNTRFSTYQPIPQPTLLQQQVFSSKKKSLTTLMSCFKIPNTYEGFIQATLDEFNSNSICKRPILKMGLKEEEVIRTPQRTDATLINLVSKIKSKLRIEWNYDLTLNESMNLGMWGHHNQLWMIWLISQKFQMPQKFDKFKEFV